MKHPGEQELTLYSSGDLKTIAMWRVGMHVRSCMQCAAEVANTAAVMTALRTQPGELPATLHWDRLAAEMTANIHLGLEAGECIRPVRAHPRHTLPWRAVTVMAGLSGVLITGAWWLNPPRDYRETALRPSPIEVRSSQGGIEVKENGSAMILMHTRGQQRPIIVSTPGSLRARFVDQDTGQVTINNVYSD